jgi:CspA family cold shock protein
MLQDVSEICGLASAGPFFFGLHHIPSRTKEKTSIRGAGGSMRYTGRVKWFNDAKGYGFIQREEGADLFVHYTNIEGQGFRSLKENDEVEFEVNEGPKGLQAMNVTKVGA